LLVPRKQEGVNRQVTGPLTQRKDTGEAA
jgi:hypothetical protein